MSINEEHRQVEIAAQAEELTRTLAHSTRTVPVPADSYQLLGELRATVEHLEQVCRQLATWHEATAPANATMATEELTDAAHALDTASDALSRAHSANGTVRWPAPEADGHRP